MAIYLFTDFGAADIYVGQVKAGLEQQAPGVAVIDLLHDAPDFNAHTSAHLLAALAARIPPGSVTLAVVDPGVGGARAAVALNADGRWFVGPDNGLLSVLAARATAVDIRRIVWRPQLSSASFHGRDLFAPIVADIACGAVLDEKLEVSARLNVELGAADLAEIIFIDHYGNASTGLRADSRESAQLLIAGRSISYARVFSDVPAGSLFWYVNSLGLVEIAGNRCSASALLGLSIGQPVELTGA